MYKEEALAC